MNKQVVGFLFSPDKEQVVLILKNKPSWQNELLNGIGGHVKEGETLKETMVRKFTEETGVKIETWKQFANGTNIDNTVKVYFYKAFDVELENVKSITDEEIYIVNVIDFIRNANRFPSVYNIRWLIQLALDEKTIETTFIFDLNK